MLRKLIIKNAPIINGFLCFIFGFFTAHYFLNGMINVWEIVVGATALTLFIVNLKIISKGD